MKKFFKEHGAGMLTVLILAASLVLALAGEPSAAITNPGGWLLVRGITLVWSVVVSIGSYSKWRKPVFNNSMYKWIAIWIIFWQVLAIFYIQEWCVDGI